jgi:DNA invertase Pin-like site-specific DNA recombinase
MSENKPYPMSGRIDVVFIRKSTQAQEDQGQRDNVLKMLKDVGLYVPADNWFFGTVSRRKVKTNVGFNRLMTLIEEDRVGTVYVESQDRWGTRDRVELFALLGTLRGHGTRLYDLRDRKDLTENDFATEMLAVLGSFKSEKELKDTSYRSLRSRVANFQSTGTWPTGTHPYGYGKRCFSADGALLWEWQPFNRSQGQLFYPVDGGGLTPVGPADARIPRKARSDVIRLVPSSNPDYVRAVQLVFDLYTRLGLSRRKISERLNSEGLLFNGGVFTHPDITHMLQNPAYAGDTYFGKLQTGELHTFDAKGLIVEVAQKTEARYRDMTQCQIKRDTHKALVDRKTWEMAQEKLAAERQRTSHSPRNPNYYLKQLFVCGHCGKGMAARTDTHPDSGKKRVYYVCSTYIAGRCNGHPTACGYHRITHEDAETLLMTKIRELNLPFEETASEGARANLNSRLIRLGIDDDASDKQWTRMFEEGIDALASYLIDAFPEAVTWPTVQKLRKLAFYSYTGDLDKRPDDYKPFFGLPVNMAALRAAVQKAEALMAEEARKKVTQLEEDHAAYTRAWVKATSDLQQSVLKQDMERLEGEFAPGSRARCCFRTVSPLCARRRTNARPSVRSYWPSGRRWKAGRRGKPCAACSILSRCSGRRPGIRPA